MTADWDDILQGCLRRERGAQQRLYAMYFPYGMSIAIRYCDDRDQAVAVLNDGFLKVFRKLDRYDPAKPFKPWFRVLVVRAALDFLKAQRKHMSPVELKEQVVVTGREDILSRIGYDELLAMIRRLSAGYRAVFNLYVLDGFKHEEIAEQLGITVGTSKSNLFKARAHLRRMVEESMGVASTNQTSVPS